MLGIGDLAHAYEAALTQAAARAQGVNAYAAELTDRSGAQEQNTQSGPEVTNREVCDSATALDCCISKVGALRCRPCQCGPFLRRTTAHGAGSRSLWDWSFYRGFNQQN